jgi:hypothetical protein
MIKRFTLVTIPLIVALLLIQTKGNLVHSNGSGSPAGHTGSPSDGMTCTMSGCHAGTASVSPVQIISSNIPASGYIPGTQYTITATLTGLTGVNNKCGFQISPQGPGGVLRGTPIITSTGTKIVSSKYITHTNTGNTGTGGSKTWSFDWIAPTAGSGAVTFYGAFNYANGTGTASGDVIRTTSLAVSEDLTVGVSEITTQVNARLFPNPVVDNATFEFELESAAEVRINIMDVAGRTLQEEMQLQGIAGMQSVQINIPSDWPAGIYKISMNAGNQQAVRNFMKQ